MSAKTIQPIPESEGTCQRCGEHIAFPITMQGENVPCPHCGKETTLIASSAREPQKPGYGGLPLLLAGILLVLCLIAAGILWIICQPEQHIVTLQVPSRYSDVIRDVGKIQFLAGQYDEAQRIFPSILDLSPAINGFHTDQENHPELSLNNPQDNQELAVSCAMVYAVGCAFAVDCQKCTDESPTAEDYQKTSEHYASLTNFCAILIQQLNIAGANP